MPQLSLNIGSDTFLPSQFLQEKKSELNIPIKPLESALNWITKQDQLSDLATRSLRVYGSGLAGLEIVFALRKRIYWDNGINTKTNKAKVNKNMDYERIKSLMISLGFYE